MTNRALYTMLMAAAGLCVQGFDHYYEPPTMMDAGLTLIDDMAPASSATLHARAKMGERGGSWALVWDYQDSDNLRRAVLTIAPTDRFYEIYPPQASLTVERVAGGETTETRSIDLTGHISAQDFNSIKIVYAEGEATLYVGHDEEAATATVEMEADGAVGFWSSGGALCQRLQSEHTNQPERAMTTLTSIDTLRARIAASTDPMEGYWQYLDSNIDSRKSAIGGTYTLAIAGNGDGYDIVYISGADHQGSQWQPMDLKGRLKPTIFAGHYDLEWYTSARQRLDAENNAQLSDDGAILTLRFPLLGSQIRFSRMAQR